MVNWVELLERRGVPAGIAAGQGLQLAAYQQDLLRFAAARNLISRRDPPAELEKLIGEAIAAAFRHPPPQAGFADLGSGAGMPGLVWAVLYPELEVSLIERRRSRADFLLREARALQLSRVQVLAEDAEALAAKAEFAGFACVLAKAVAAPARTLRLAQGLLRPGAELILFGRPKWNVYSELAMDGWTHHELDLVPDPGGPVFAPAALHCFRREL